MAEEAWPLLEELDDAFPAPPAGEAPLEEDTAAVEAGAPPCPPLELAATTPDEPFDAAPFDADELAMLEDPGLAVAGPVVTEAASPPLPKRLSPEVPPQVATLAVPAAVAPVRRRIAPSFFKAP